MGNQLPRKECLWNIFLLTVVIVVISKLFLGTFYSTPVFLPVMIPLYRNRKKQLLKKRKQNFENQFKDMLVSLSDALKTGYSVENAISESYKDMNDIYGYDSDICGEMRKMISAIKLNVPIEQVFREFAEYSELKTATLFYRLFSVAKKMGGNMADVIKSVTDDIALKNSVREEIETEIHSKRMEHRIMMVIPLLFICYIRISSQGFLNVMYKTSIGKIIMAICVGIYFIAYFWGEKITEQEE